MPKGPQGQKRPADVIGAAVKVMRIATGEETEDAPKPKSAIAVSRGHEGGKKGGSARAKALTKERRREIAKKAAKTRWKTGASN
jgi:hypothetical protein